MILIIFLLFLTIIITAKIKRSKKAKNKVNEGDRLHLILQNVEAYDGSGKGQIRLEDIK